MKVFGSNASLFLEDEPDSDGDLGVVMVLSSDDLAEGDGRTWLREEDAEKLIKHLQRVFEL